WVIGTSPKLAVAASLAVATGLPADLTTAVGPDKAGLLLLAPPAIGLTATATRHNSAISSLVPMDTNSLCFIMITCGFENRVMLLSRRTQADQRVVTDCGK